MNDLKRNTRRIFWLYFALLVLAAAWLVKFIFIDSKTIVLNSYNPRLNMINENIIRGEIFDANRNILAQTVKADGISTRVYPYADMFAHMVGYSQLGGMGVEAKQSLSLTTLDRDILQRLNQVITGEDLKGNSLVLTLDAELQRAAYECLGTQKGTILMMEPSTGKILCCVSYPSFDPNYISENWVGLRDDTENNPLINRAIQGLYPPGSVFKIVTSVSVMRFLQEDISYTCTGSEIFDGKLIRCYNGNAHGNVNMEKAFAVSCNTYFAYLGNELGAERLKQTAEELNFNQTISFTNVVSSFELNESSGVSELVETAIGQGKTQVTPLYMAMLVSAIANDGRLMEPYVVDYAKTPTGEIRDKQLPKLSGSLFSSEESRILTKMMGSVVTSGTAIALSMPDITVAGKTGTAENSAGEGREHAWFAGFAPADDPQLVIVVLLENVGSSSNALPIAKKMIKAFTN